MVQRKKPAKQKNKPQNKPPSKFRKDIIGILLLAAAVFILLANLSSATGVIGLYIVKLFLKASVGIGIYALPLFVAILGLIVMAGHDVRKLTIRMLGVFILFGVFITTAQLFTEKLTPATEGLGGVLGYAARVILERTIGLGGTYIALVAIGVISLLLALNLTLMDISTNLKESAAKRDSKKKRKRVLEEAKKAIRPEMTSIIPPVKEKTPPSPKKKEEESIGPLPKTSRKKSAGYKLPPLDLLNKPSPQEKEKKAKQKEATEVRKQILEEALQNFNVAAKVTGISQGPVVTRFEVQPEPGVKVSKIASLADDIALNLASHGVRIEAPVPGKSVVGIEVPNSTVSFIHLGEIARTLEFRQSPAKLLVSVGKDVSGTSINGDLTRMPHLLIAGATGSGKSVCINSLIMSLLLRCSPDDVKFLMIDPKMVELTTYEGIPHLLAPVVTDPKKAAATLKQWVMTEMDRRYKEFFAAGVRNIEAYNKKISKEEIKEKAVAERNLKKEDEEETLLPEKLPYIVVIIDELADLMMVSGAEVEMTICRVAQMARATGIHLVIATQRPSVDVITGLIKANIPSRISFAVSSQVDARVILDYAGAEKLLGRGDMLYHPIGAMKSVRAQGSFVSDEEIERIVNFVKEQAPPSYSQEIMDIKAEDIAKGAKEVGSKDDLFPQAAKLVIGSGQASTSYLQRKLLIGYNRAARLMDELEAAKIVTAPEGENKPRRILAGFETLKSMGIE